MPNSNSAAIKDRMSKNMDKWDTFFSDCVENIVGKEEIACYEQLLLFSQCFQKLFADALK